MISTNSHSERRLLHTVSDARPPFYVGVDIGGTSIKIGLVDELGNSLYSGEIDADGTHKGTVVIKTEPDPQTTAEQMSAAILALLNKQGITDIGGIGLGCPATINKTTRKLRRPPNLPTWENFALCDAVEQLTNLPVIFCNDANAAAYGEYWVGSANGHSSLVLLTLGTGIGAGIIIDGRSIDGDIGYGGECGHMIIDSAENAALCGCGHRGHLEAYCSATGVAKRTIAQVMLKDSSIRAKITPSTRLSEIPKIVYSEAEGGDTLAMNIIDDTAKYLAVGIVSILNTVDPACVLLGGAMTFGGKRSPLGQRFLAQIVQEIKLRAFPAIAENVLVDFAVLGSDAGYIGAAGLMRESVKGKK